MSNPLSKQKRTLEIQLGGSIGSLVGTIGAGITIIMYIPLPLITKVFIAIGIFGAALIGAVQTFQIWSQYKQFNDAIKMFENKPTEKTVNAVSVEKDKSYLG